MMGDECMREAVNRETGTGVRRAVRNMERMAGILLALWCLLPIAMSAYDLIANALGLFPSDAELLAEGFHIGYINYNRGLAAYYHAFLYIGIPTLLFAILSLLICRPRVFSRDAIRNMPWFYLLLALLIWSIISTLQARDIQRALLGKSYGRDGLFSYFIYGGVFLCASMIRSEKHRRRILRLYGGVVCYLALLMIVQEATRSSFLDHSFPSFRAVVFNQFNHFGYILCMGVLAFAGLWMYDREVGKVLRALYLVGFALLLYALLLNDTFGSYLATLVALPVIYLFYARSGREVRRADWLPAILFVLISALNILNLLPGTNSLLWNLTHFGLDLKNVALGREEAAYAGTGRFTLWKDTLVRIGQRPIFGFGPEGFWGEYAITNNDSTHNEYLRIAGFLGIPALLMYLGALVTLARHHWKAMRQLSPMVLAVAGVTVVYLISAFFGNPLFNTVPYFWMFYGLTTADGVNPPLLAPELAGIESRIEAKTNKKRLAVIIAIGVLLVAAVSVAANHLANKTEKADELSDLQCMRGAELMAELYFKDDALTGGVYWFDAGSYALLSGDEAKPSPYGKGTRRNGNAFEGFAAEYGADYAYDGSVDYRGKIIQLTVTTDENGELNTEITWVEG